ncbi:MAG: hypothetical protein QOH52_3124 [Pseudonocardiales bacterium]|nr:hypothetical protein [Pseudonocardiales bacterium]
MTTYDLANPTKQCRPPVSSVVDPGGRGIRRRSRDNSAPSIPTYATDDGCAQLLDQALQQVPYELTGDENSSFPLLAALKSFDAARGSDAARELVFVAAANHRTADERRTAEYLLRNRRDVVDGHRSPKSLLFAARYAAELDVRRLRRREWPLPRALAAPATEEASSNAEGMSAGDMAIRSLRAVVGSWLITPALEDQVLAAVAIALDVAGRHALNRGRGPAVLAMRSDARPHSRLVTYLRDEFGNDEIACNLARLLVGPDGTPIETGLLWWSVRRDLAPEHVPAVIRQRWMQGLRVASGADASARSCPQPPARLVDDAEANAYKSGITDGRRRVSLDPRRFAHRDEKSEREASGE